jgi:hypothetical protein
VAKISDAPAEQEEIFGRGLQMTIRKFDKKSKILDVEGVQSEKKSKGHGSSFVVPLSANDDSKPYNRFVYDGDIAGIIIHPADEPGEAINLFDDE